MALDESAAALWDPRRDRGTARLLFMVPAGQALQAAIKCMSESHHLAERIGRAAFALDLLHQSVSDRYVNTPELRQKLLTAGNAVRAAAFTLELDCLSSAKNERGSYNWEVRSRRKSAELSALIAAINNAIVAEGLPRGGGHSAHLTLSYSAASTLLSEEPISPIEWTIDSFALVLGEQGPRGYRYQALDSWRLGPEARRAVQTSLF